MKKVLESVSSHTESHWLNFKCNQCGLFFHMHQYACMGKQKFTLVAFVWLLSTVCNHMTLNNICSRGGIITLVAFVRFHWMIFFFTVVVFMWLFVRLLIYICFSGSPIYLIQELILWINIWDWNLNYKRAYHSLYYLSHLESQEDKSFEDMRILISQDVRILKSQDLRILES